ncbi:MAG: cobalt-precorrin-5B (C(1))-methyltransferase CbiD [bacterium]
MPIHEKSSIHGKSPVHEKPSFHEKTPLHGQITGKSGHPQQSRQPRGANLRPGYTTGSCAAAAARACVEHLLLQKDFAVTSLLLPSGERLFLHPVNPLMGENWAACGIIKDAGDDPDVTDGIEIRARVVMIDSQPGRDSEPGLDSRPGIDLQSANSTRGNNTGLDTIGLDIIGSNDIGSNDIWIVGGEGVGLITKEGLELPPGEPAINPVPRRMIRDNIREILKEAKSFSGSVMVEISVPQGRTVSLKTINARLGIVGGISILGTTGLVEPISTLAWQDTIVACLKVAKASGCEGVVLSPGRSSEAAARRIFPWWPEEAFIMIGDYVGFSLDEARRLHFQQIIISAQFAKLIKISQGCLQTHVHHSQIDMSWLSEIAHQTGYGKETLAFIAQAHTARQIYQYLRERSDSLFFSTLVYRISKALGIRCILFSYEGEKIADSQEGMEGNGMAGQIQI